MCCWSAACVRGMLCRALDLCAKSCFLASFTSMVWLVRSYISTTKHSSSDIDSSVISLGMRKSSSKASVTSGNPFQISQAVFFPLPANEDTVSHPVRIWKMGYGSTLTWVHGGSQLVNSYVNTGRWFQYQELSTARQDCERSHSQYHNISIHSANGHLPHPLPHSICASVRLLVWTWGEAG